AAPLRPRQHLLQHQLVREAVAHGATPRLSTTRASPARTVNELVPAPTLAPRSGSANLAGAPKLLLNGASAKSQLMTVLAQNPAPPPPAPPLDDPPEPPPKYPPPPPASLG